MRTYALLLIGLLPALAPTAWAAGAATPVDAQRAFERARAALGAQSVYFETDQAIVDDEQSSVVVDAVHLAQDFPNDVLRVSGSSDAGERDPALAQRRAEAVKRQLLLLGIPARRIEAAGAVRESTACSDERCRAGQRRADIEHVWR